MLILLRTQVDRTDKTPVTARRARVGGLCGFRGAAERVTHRKPEGRTLRRRAGEQEIRPKSSAAGSVERGNAATVENTETGKIEGFWTPRRESSRLWICQGIKMQKR